jgi:hypothetical protein
MGACPNSPAAALSMPQTNAVTSTMVTCASLEVLKVITTGILLLERDNH